MKMKPLWVAMLLGVLSTTGCKDARNTDAVVPEAPVQRNWVSVPALPVIQDAVFSLSPTFNGERNELAMKQICALARGETDQSRVNVFLHQQGIDATKIPAQNSPLSLLVNGDKAAQTAACAAYLATSVLATVDVDEFMHDVRVPVASERPQQQPNGKARRSANGKSGKQAAETPAQPEFRVVRQVDQRMLNQVLPIKIAEARANADVFALIAQELQRRPGLTMQEYRQQASELFARLAPTYLKRIREQLPPAGVEYQLVRLDGDGFVFTTTQGARFEYTVDGLRLRQDGIVWYGDGKLLGQDHLLTVKYFPDEVSELLAPTGR
ncbi:hypothetical protein D3C78_880730 [compost metagenome]